jgi:hypothetical protein
MARRGRSKRERKKPRLAAFEMTVGGGHAGGGHDVSCPCSEGAKKVAAGFGGSEVAGPFPGGVEDAEDFEGVCADSIGDEVASVGDDEFARAGDSTGAADGGIFA